MVMAAKLETVGEYVYLWNNPLHPVVLDSFCEPGSLGPSCCAMVRSNCFVSISTSTYSQYSELNCEDNKHEVRLFDKQ